MRWEKKALFCQWLRNETHNWMACGELLVRIKHVSLPIHPANTLIYLIVVCNLF